MARGVDYTPWLGPVETWPRDLFGHPVPPPGTFYEAGYMLRLAFLRFYVVGFYRPIGRPALRWAQRRQARS
jgi:hypothetical protein